MRSANSFCDIMESESKLGSENACENKERCEAKHDAECSSWEVRAIDIKTL